MNEFEENKYLEIKNELVECVIDKKIDNYITNRNELTHYYNVGKMIVDAQGGEEHAKYGDGLIRKFSERLSRELGKGYSSRILNLMRKYYLFQKVHAVHAQLSWMHYRELLFLDNNNEINYYIDISIKEKLGYRQLHKRIKDREYQRLDEKTRSKLINKEELDVYDGIKNPIYINTYGDNIKEKIEEKSLKKYIIKDLDNFLKQLGTRFSYIANEYKIIIGNTYNCIDLLLFNYNYNCFVVVELKVTRSKKDHLGQIQVYMNYIDKHIKRINQDKTIGIVVCKKDERYLIEYSSDPRIKITTYKLV